MSRKNIVVLTSGLSGSSVVTGLLAESGLSTGEKTVFKNNSTGVYETYENEQLVKLNESLLKQLGIKLDLSSWYEPDLYDQISTAVSKVDLKPFQAFIDKCYQQEKPWIWKDPRLWFTFGFWKTLLQPETVDIVIMYRNPLPLWVSMINKRQIVNYFSLKNHEKKSRQRLHNILINAGFRVTVMNYDLLISKPSLTLEYLNQSLNLELTVNNLKKIFRGTLGSRTYSIKQLFWACLIYLKNFSSQKVF